MIKKRLAKEWLYFLGCFLFGLLIVPLLLLIIARLFIDHDNSNLSDFYSLLVAKGDWLTAWLLVIGPYVIFQIIRSVIWAYKTVQTPDAPREAKNEEHL